MAFPASATPFPVYGQEFDFTVVILSSATGNPLTGGLTGLAGNISIDGAAFASTGVTVAEIGTTGFVKVTIAATQMQSKVTAFNISASNTNAMYAVGEIVPINLTEFSGRADAETVKRFEHYMMDVMYAALNKHAVDRTNGTYTIYKNDGATAKVDGTISDTGTSGIKGHLD
jgi:hypothetical protein